MGSCRRRIRRISIRPRLLRSLGFSSSWEPRFSKPSRKPSNSSRFVGTLRSVLSRWCQNVIKRPLARHQVHLAIPHIRLIYTEYRRADERTRTAFLLQLRVCCRTCEPVLIRPAFWLIYAVFALSGNVCRPLGSALYQPGCGKHGFVAILPPYHVHYPFKVQNTLSRYSGHCSTTRVTERCTSSGCPQVNPSSRTGLLHPSPCFHLDPRGSHLLEANSDCDGASPDRPRPVDRGRCRAVGIG
jgi:hypothetical protein